MKFISIKCPECGANLSIKEDREFCFCEYCGTKIMCIDENNHKYTHNHTYTRIDEAEIIRAETERMVILNRLKREDLERKSKKKKETFGCAGRLLKLLFKTMLVLFLLFLVLIGVMAMEQGPEELSFVGLVAAYGLFFMWDHRESKK